MVSAVHRRALRYLAVPVTTLLVLLCLVYNLKTGKDNFSVRRNSTCQSTIVSAYYNISSKHSPTEYISWMTNFLSLQDCLVVFTTQDLVPLIRSLRSARLPLKIVTRPLNSFFVAKMLSDTGWEAQESLDPELEVGHSRQLYWIWNEKSAMLKDVSLMNPFSSEYFAWLDIGAIRHTWWNGKLLMQHLPAKEGILLLNVGTFQGSELRLINGISKSSFFQENRIGGGMIGGSKIAIAKWAKLFYKTLERYFSMNIFGGKDQSVMATTCLESDICLLLDGTPAHPWFYNEPRWFRLQDYYLGRLSEEPTRLNLSSIQPS